MVCFAECFVFLSLPLPPSSPTRLSLSLAREGRHPRLSDRQAKADEREGGKERRRKERLKGKASDRASAVEGSVCA